MTVEYDPKLMAKAASLKTATIGKSILTKSKAIKKSSPLSFKAYLMSKKRTTIGSRGGRTLNIRG